MVKTTKAEQEEPLEKKLWKAADKLRKNMDAAEYKHVALGLIFLKYISDAFEELFQQLNADYDLVRTKHLLRYFGLALYCLCLSLCIRCFASPVPLLSLYISPATSTPYTP